ncbi:MAG: SURF1 family protein [Dehalococcoidia bacterium]
MPFRLPTPVLVALLALAFAVLVGLGVWQLQRNAWRNGLVAERNAQITGAPLTTAEALTREPADLEYRLVSLEGAWDPDAVMILANRARYGVKGENVVQPLVVAPGRAVLVDRGWYPAAERDAVLAQLAAQGPEARVRGLARYVEGLRASRTTAGTWTGIAPAAMSEGRPYDLAPWFVIEGEVLEANAGIPRTYPAQGFVPYASPVPHMEYALTWFGIAAALVVIAVVRLVVEPRRARAREEAAGG